jgi:hypothetical protein
MLVLSMTMTEFRPGYGFILSSSPSIKLLKLAALYEPARTARCKTPLKERAGSTEYLESIRQGQTASNNALDSLDVNVMPPSLLSNRCPSPTPFCGVAIACRLIDEDKLIRTVSYRHVNLEIGACFFVTLNSHPGHLCRAELRSSHVITDHLHASLCILGVSEPSRLSKDKH